MKERFLTVLVPIKDSDATTVTDLPAVSPDNINVIYKHAGVYKRVWLNPTTNQYEYHEVVDREFPYLGKPLEIFDFTYDATRMGSAPTITAQGIMWYADKDSSGNDVTLEGLWSQECHVSFNGENFYLKQIPTSSKSNEDARYKYDIDFVSERVVLERVYLYDVVQPFVSSKPISESAQFSFYGDITELAKRINASLLRSGLATIALRPGVTPTSFLTYEEFNAVGLGTYTGSKDTSDTYLIVPEIHYPHANIYEHFGGNYTKYLLNRVYLVDNPQSYHIGPSDGGYEEIYDGEPRLSGYKCLIGKDKKGVITTSEEKFITFENNTIHEALQQFHDTFGLQYYIYRDTDSNGDFTGDTIIMVADCQHDFADWDATAASGEGDYTRDSDGIPTTTHPFDYGVEGALLSKEKANTTDKIITRITGVGSEENIPWYYPNPNADGWICPVYKRRKIEIISGAAIITGMEEIPDMVSYQSSEGSTIPEAVLYEKYLKNRLGFEFIYRKHIGSYYMPSDMAQFYGRWSGGVWLLSVTFEISVAEVFHLEPNNIWCSYDGVEPSQVVFLKKNSSGEYTGVGYGTIQTLPCLEFSSGDYRITFNFPFSDQPSVDDFNWYWVPYPSGAGNPNWAYPLLVKASKVTEEEVLSLEMVWTGSYYYWYYTDRNGVRRVAFAYAAGNDSYYYNLGFYPVVNGVTYNPDGAVKILTDLSAEHGGWNGKYYTITIQHQDIASQTEVNIMSDDNIYRHYISGSFGIYTKHWQKSRGDVDLSNFGMSLTDNAVYGDTITFKRLKYVTPQQKLMPELYIKTYGERRFYNAHNYWVNNDLLVGVADPLIGEVQSGTKVKNPLYKEKETDADNKHYFFENEFMASMPREHIENFDDVKPTIKEQINYIRVHPSLSQFSDNPEQYYTLNTTTGVYTQCSSLSTYSSATPYYSPVRIDIVQEFSYDDLDNNEIWESTTEEGGSGEYKHSLFFAKLRPLGFNIFDLALQEDMVLSMTSGHCGACNFKIAVDENTKKNPVQIWEHNVYKKNEDGTYTPTPYTKGSLRRYVDTRGLYYKIGNNYYDIHEHSGYYSRVLDYSQYSQNQYKVADFDEDDVADGLVGSMKNKSKIVFAGDVVTRGFFIESQQDTSENYVWIALYKDTETHGVIMPSAQPDYGDENYSHYIEPRGCVYTDRKTGEVETLTDDEADNFVLTNIRLPQAYLRRAERDLSRKIIAYMYDNNYQKFNFSIKLSRIYLAGNAGVDDNLNENSVLYVTFNNKIYRQYVKHYTYKMTKDAVLPEISVEMNEELQVSRTTIEQQSAMQARINYNNRWRWRRDIEEAERRIDERTISRYGESVMEGNVINKENRTSFGRLSKLSNKNSMDLVDTQVDIEKNHFKRVDFEVLHGTDLRIGDEIHLPTSFQRGQRMIKRKWDVSKQEFVEDAEQTFAPAFIDNTNKRFVQTGYVHVGGNNAPAFAQDTYYKFEDGSYILLTEQPSDWATAWASYYKEGVSLDLTPARVNATYRRIVWGNDPDDEIIPIEIAESEFAVNTPDSEGLGKASDISIIRHTVEKRFVDNNMSVESETCGGIQGKPVEHIATVTVDNVKYLFWTDKEGNNVEYQMGPGSCQHDPFEV